MPDSEPARSIAPETWLRGRRAVDVVLRPLERFLHVEAASGVLLLVAALVALAWANSPWAASYAAFWHAPVTIGAGPFISTASVHFWINDALMVVFFFVVGLEIRREIHGGELSEPRRAALPIAAALGGMVIPAILFLALNRGLPSQRGWGVPMATDIAFAVGVLALLGNRVPAALRVLLLALAIIDDIGAIIVIALFYSTGISAGGLLLAVAGVAGVLLMQRLGVRRSIAYVAPGFVIWLGCLRAGIHPTIAGVILGLLTPAKAWFGERGFVDAIRGAIAGVGDPHGAAAQQKEESLLAAREEVKQAQREAVAPVVRLQGALHPIVAFAIMPLFALANAGVNVRGVGLTDVGTRPVLVGITLGLVVGKPVGVVAMSYLAVRLRLAALPAGVTWKGVVLVGVVAGIGFTMAIFIAGLAFAESPTEGPAKLAILVASVVSGVAAVSAGRLLLRGKADPAAAATASQAEAAADV